MNVDLDTAKKILNHNLRWVGLGFLICTGLVFLTFSLGCCYRRSTIEETQEHADSIIADIRKQEKQRKENEILQKHAKIREDMEAKHPGLSTVSHDDQKRLLLGQSYSSKE